MSSENDERPNRQGRIYMPPEVVPTEPTIPEVYYHQFAKDYYIANDEGSYIKVNEDSLKRLLLLRGFGIQRLEGVPSQADEIIRDTQLTNYIDFPGPLAGYEKGLVHVNNNKILVTESPRIVKANNDNNWECFEFIDTLLGAQAMYIHAWVKLAREALLSKRFRRGQALVIVGEPDHGKSFFIRLVAEMLGGRVANPWQYLRGETSFNEDLFGCELLAIDDSGSDDNWKGRKRLGDAIKQFCGDGFPRCHGKGKKPIALSPFWRMIIALNDEMEDIQVLPPLTHGVQDKLIILKTQRRAVVEDTTTLDQWEAYWNKLKDSVPTYLAWLDEWKIPEEMQSARFGMKHYHHEEIVHALSEFTPEQRLNQLVDQVYDWEDSPEGITVTARELESTLKASHIDRDAHELLKGYGNTGKFLSRLVRTTPARFRRIGRKGGDGVVQYRILPPVSVHKKAGSF